MCSKLIMVASVFCEEAVQGQMTEKFANCLLTSDNDVVDGNEYKLDSVSNETHDGKADGAGDGDLLELLGIWLGACANETLRILGEVIASVDQVANWVTLVCHEAWQLGQCTFFCCGRHGLTESR